MAQKKVETPLTASQQQQFSTASPISATNLTSYSANVSKLFRNGVGFSSSVNVGRSADNLLNQLGVSTSDAGLQLIVPLMSGRGRNVVGAAETAAEIEVGSREFDLQQTAEQLLTNTAVSYWALVAAKRHVQVSTGSEDRGRVLQKTVQALIDADQVPRNDIYEVNANLADRVATRIAAQQTMVQARERLAVDMGIPPAAVLAIGDPADDFPPLDATINMATDDSLKEYIDEALHNRPDLVAAQRREAQAKLLLGASEKQIQPQLNLQLGAGYSQLRDAGGLTDFFAAPFSNLHPPSLQAGLVYQYSVANNLAQGQLLANQASYREAQLQSAELERQITATVIIAVENVRNSISRVQSAREAVSAFQQTLRGQQEKFNLGQVSLTELLTVEDRLTTALSNEVDAELSYVLAVADLRLATGTLLPTTNARQVDASVFRNVPRVRHQP